MKRFIIFSLILFSTSCARAPLPKLQVSTSEQIPNGCIGVKVRGELTRLEFVNLFNCLNNGSALKELKSLLIGTVERATISTNIYNEILGKRLLISNDYLRSTRAYLQSWSLFKSKTASIRRALKSDTIDNLTNVLASIDDDEFLKLAHETINKTNFAQILETLFKGLNHSQKEEFLKALSKNISKEKSDYFLTKWRTYAEFLNTLNFSKNNKSMKALHLLAKKNIFAQIQSIINSLSSEERTFMNDFISYQLNPKYRSTTIFKDKLHEKYIKRELDTEKFNELKIKLKEFHKTFPQTNFASLIELLLSLDRPMKSIDGKEDILTSLGNLMKSFYTVVLLKLDIPKKISQNNPPTNHPFGPDHPVSRLFSKIITLIYSTRETLQIIYDDEEDLERILNERLLGTLPEYSRSEDLDKLSKLKDKIEESTDEEEKKQRELELETLLNQTWALYSHVVEQSENTILGKLVKDYTKTWIDYKPLPLLFVKEARRLAPPDPSKQDLIKALESVVTFRKTIPLLRTLKQDLKIWINLLHQNQEWLNGVEPIKILMKINNSPSILKEILKSVGELDKDLFKTNLEKGITEFIIPHVFTPLLPFDEFLRRGEIPDESFLTELVEFIKRYEGEYPTSDLFLIDALLKSYQGNNEFFFSSKDYSPWRGVNIMSRVHLFSSFTAPLMQLPAKSGSIDEAVELLYFLHSNQPPFISMTEDFELINFWADEIEMLPSIFMQLFEIRRLGSSIDKFVQDSFGEDQIIIQSLHNLIDRISSRQQNDLLANSIYNDLLPLTETLFSDNYIVTSLSDSSTLPLEFRVLFTILGSDFLMSSVPKLFHDRDATKSALIYLRDGLNQEDGLYRTMRVFTRLLDTKN